MLYNLLNEKFDLTTVDWVLCTNLFEIRDFEIINASENNELAV